MNSPLTARQEECLRLTRFKTDKQIAEELGLAEATVKKHVAEACQRMGVNRRKAALALLEQADRETEPMARVAAVEPPKPEQVQPLRSGYRPPPRGLLPRVVIVGVATILLVLVIQATTRLMFEVHGQVDQIDKAVTPPQEVPAPSPES